MASEWTFTAEGVTSSFVPVSDGDASPAWRTPAKVKENHLIGTKRSEINVFGALPPRLECVVLADASNYAVLVMQDAAQGQLTDDEGLVVTATMVIGDVGWLAGDTYQVKVTFIQPGT